MDAGVFSVVANAAWSCAQSTRLFRNLKRARSWPAIHMRVSSLLVWFLSSSLDLAILYLCKTDTERMHSLGFMTHPSSAALAMLDWLGEPETYQRFLRSLDELDNQDRQRADQFLMDTLVVQHIVQMNALGLAVDLPQVILVLLRLWAHRPRSQSANEHLCRLVWHRNSRHRYGQSLRRNFMLCITSLPVAREYSSEETTDRVLR